eukprot:1157108-Pelagomonas_calceolata.AAC.3
MHTYTLVHTKRWLAKAALCSAPSVALHTSAGIFLYSTQRTVHSKCEQEAHDALLILAMSSTSVALYTAAEILLHSIYKHAHSAQCNVSASKRAQEIATTKLTNTVHQHLCCATDNLLNLLCTGLCCKPAILARTKQTYAATRGKFKQGLLFYARLYCRLDCKDFRHRHRRTCRFSRHRHQRSGWQDPWHRRRGILSAILILFCSGFSASLSSLAHRFKASIVRTDVVEHRIKARYDVLY